MTGTQTDLSAVDYYEPGTGFQLNQWLRIADTDLQAAETKYFL